MESIDLRLLRYFVAVAEEGVLTRAALRLGIQQPPLSQQIRLLENALGVTLFRRLPRGMELTDCGRAFLEQAYDILGRMAESIETVRRVAQGRTGHLSVGFTESASLHPLVPAALRAFRQQEPGVTFHADECGSLELMKGLETRKMDAVFARAISDIPSCVAVERVLVEPMVVALPAAHPFAQEPRSFVALPELAMESLIFTHRTSGPGFYDAIILACRSAGFVPQIALETRRNLVSLSMVSAELGLAIMPASMRHVRMDGVIYKELIDAPSLGAPLHLAYRTDVSAGALARFIELTRNLVAGISGEAEPIALAFP
jgi:DNA-binding transcriptional LysR family regulator